MPWIHVADLAASMLHGISHGSLGGPVNGTAPEPERNVDFTRKLAKGLRRPALLPAPGFALRLLLGDFAGVVLASQRAVPRALLESGFRFRYPTLELALGELLDRAPRS
jgi:NAD dependent epimerase/dehydratase family enzyme